MAQTISNMGMGLYEQQEPKQNKKSAKQLCEEKGGYWDARTNTCLLASQVKDTTPSAAKTALNEMNGVKQPVPKPVKPTTPEIFRDEDTGQLSGVTLPDGRSFIGLKPNEIKNMVSIYQDRTTLPQGTQPASTAQNQADRAARIQQLMQLGEQGLLSPQELQAIQETPIDYGQAATAGFANVIPLAVGGAAGGAAIGATAGALLGGAGAIPGAILGGIGGIVTGLFTGIRSNIKSQQSGEIAATKDVLSSARSNMRALAMVASRDPSKAEDAIKLYYDQLAQVQIAQRKLQVETTGNLNKFMNDGTQDLSDFELFLQPGGYAELQKIRLEQALLKGTPATDIELLQLSEEMNLE